MSNFIKITIYVCLFLLGFAFGNSFVDTEIKTEYIKGDTIIDSIPYTELQPVYVELPSETIYIGDTQYLYKDIDTSKIVDEFIKTKLYEQVLFDSDTLGRMKVNLSVAYNSLRSLDYEFNPVMKQTTITKIRSFEPFFTTSVNSFGFLGIGGGVYNKKVGYGLKYITNFEDKGIEASLNYKF